MYVCVRYCALCRPRLLFSGSSCIPNLHYSFFTAYFTPVAHLFLGLPLFRLYEVIIHILFLRVIKYVFFFFYLTTLFQLFLVYGFE